MRLSSVNVNVPLAGSGSVRPVARTGFTVASRKRSAFIVSRAASARRSSSLLSVISGTRRSEPSAKVPSSRSPNAPVIPSVVRTASLGAGQSKSCSRMRIVALPEKSGTSNTRPASAAVVGEADAATDVGVAAGPAGRPQPARTSATAHATRTRT